MRRRGRKNGGPKTLNVFATGRPGRAGLYGHHMHVWNQINDFNTIVNRIE